MPDLPDYDLRRPHNEPPPPPPASSPSMAPWIVGIVALIVTLGAALYYFAFLGGRDARPPDPAVEAPAVRPAGPESASGPLGAEPEPIEVPPLAETDALVRDLVRALSSHPRVAAWLATDGLVRNFVVAVENISHGESPATHLGPLRPGEPFRVIDQSELLYVDQRSFTRYTAIADAVNSVDAEGSARLYATLKPRMDEAYRELGHQEPFDAALERAIVLLLRTPAVPLQVEVEPRGIGYQFVDPRLESLTAAQKQLLRMGPQNIRVVQAKLREIALALGVPAARLP